MGAGLPYSVGCQVAFPNKSVINIDGDSSFMMTLSDLKTIAENKLPIKIIIMNNNTQDMVRVWETLFFDGKITATENVQNPMFHKLAESFGIKGIKCSSRKELEKSLEQLLNYDGPILLECEVERDMCLPLVPPGAGLHEMILDKKDITIHDNEVPS